MPAVQEENEDVDGHLMAAHDSKGTGRGAGRGGGGGRVHDAPSVTNPPPVPQISDADMAKYRKILDDCKARKDSKKRSPCFILQITGKCGSKDPANCPFSHERDANGKLTIHMTNAEKAACNAVLKSRAAARAPSTGPPAKGAGRGRGTPSAMAAAGAGGRPPRGASPRRGGGGGAGGANANPKAKPKAKADASPKGKAKAKAGRQKKKFPGNRGTGKRKPGCWNCGSTEHFARDCKVPMNQAMACTAEWSFWEGVYGDTMDDLDDEEQGLSEAFATESEFYTEEEEYEEE